jgi:hypothetical protein
MSEYHKIQSVFKRDMDNSDKSKRKQFLFGEYTRPEFELLKDIKWRFDLKCDGTNIRLTYFYCNPIIEDASRETQVSPAEAAISIQGRTDRAKLPHHLNEKLTQLFTLEKCKEVFGDISGIHHEPPLGATVILYGEGVGAKIQSNGKQYLLNADDQADFILFDVKVGYTWLRREAVEDIASKMGVRVAPIIGYGTLEDAIKMCQEGFKDPIRSVEPEGLVCRPAEELLDRLGRRIITKVKLCDFR